MNAAMIKTDFENEFPNIFAYFNGLLASVPALKEDADNVKDIIEMLG